jgi:hypothetical protein
MKRCKKTLASRTVLAAAQFCLTMALAACAADQVSAPSSDQAPGSTPAIPPGYRVEKFVRCYEEHHPSVMGQPSLIKRHDMHISMLVPQDDCLALDANGWLRVVPGQCTRMPAQSACEEKP